MLAYFMISHYQVFYYQMIDQELMLVGGPMMDWTDRHCRTSCGGFSPDGAAVRMITAAAIVRGGRGATPGVRSPEDTRSRCRWCGSETSRARGGGAGGCRASRPSYDEINT